jgi:hypothetical protein
MLMGVGFWFINPYCLDFLLLKLADTYRSCRALGLSLLSIYFCLHLFVLHCSTLVAHIYLSRSDNARKKR